MNKVAKRVVVALLTASIVVLAILFSPVAIMWPVVGVLSVMASAEYLQLLAKKMRLMTLRGFVCSAIGIALVSGALLVLPSVAWRFGNAMLLYLVAIVKFSDMGGFAVGLSSMRIFGHNHKLCPTISPNKSWEGLFGSVLASVLLSCAFVRITGFCLPKAIVFGVIAALVGTFGDLVESKFKRWVGVKDSSTFMPAGLGGFLDMFDSLLFAPALLSAFI